MTGRETPHHPKVGIVLATTVALAVGAALLASKIWPPFWPGVLLPLSLSMACFVWVWGLFSRVQRPVMLIAMLVIGALAVHLAIWLPFLFAGYLNGQGTGGFAFSVGAALITGIAVAWYILTDHLWVTLALVAGLGGLHALLARRCAA